MTDAPDRRPNGASDEGYTAGDLRRAAGISYRQLHIWQQLGIIRDVREGEAGWRRFPPRDVFVILVCTEIRNRFGVPLSALKWVADFMRQDGADHLQAALRIMSRGQVVFLLTDLKNSFVMDADIEFEDMIHLGFFRHEDPEAYILLKLNPIVNRLLACLTNPFELRIKQEVYSAIRSARGEIRLANAEEAEVIRLLRSGDFDRVTVYFKHRKAVRIESESEKKIERTAELLKMLADQPYQTMTVTQHDGEVKRVVQKRVHKPTVAVVRLQDADGRTPKLGTTRSAAKRPSR